MGKEQSWQGESKYQVLANLSERIEIRISKGYLPSRVYYSIIHNSLSMETT